jgi:Fe2+ or Zn2+ uptake regulation protein
MSQGRDDTSWLKRGKQRQAVAQALRKPMTAKEICLLARAHAPRLQLRDVWHLLTDMQNRGLVTCYNPRLVTGRLYELTARGKAAAWAAFGRDIPPGPTNIDWRNYSWVVRAKVRRLTLLDLAELEARAGESQTATIIRKHLRTEHAVGLNPVVRALKELLSLGLVREAGRTRTRCCKLYQLTAAGWRIVKQLRH